ncbi:23S rRNA (adenine(2503)-C2)-methyltransferase [Ferroacidibacillus organovorans]|uniref:Probable dual-specificity RNA methyltransferase RlmN n=2 Tax=Ferroacidibacillus organovorans TaxID=1765683 RepID=A0A162SEW9_9BACL|nr:23S rRNA (adenine(2503)-C(2))-methyltransferase RlmN [Ferroacidibacillus organovorans]OAG92190.1 23S rRNA (adenine(2503)-C2)-methyltransferase [Ferroacidibacillus organovorans]OPG16181.1 23S rRNA (adenine(2503)-C(2))-methyltransferase [Ferroacidibacillus organovorans]
MEREGICMKPLILDLTRQQIEQWVREEGQPAYRATQVFHWIYQRRVTAFAEMTDLPKALRERLAESFVLTSLREVTRQISKKDGTTKFLFALADGSTIETVIMRHDYGVSVCVSSQVGCKMGCTFCASTLGGLIRHLRAGEIVEQLIWCQRMLDLEGERVKSVVMMGSGEPLENYDAALRFVDLVTDAEGLMIGQRHITISTVGLVPAIYRLADEHRGITLAVSLHAADDATRSSMMPINRAYNIAKLMEACHYYYRETGRRISFEYALIANVNDSLEHARRLAEVVSTLPCHVNLIPVNYVPERDLKRTEQAQIRAFTRELERLSIKATVRREMGSDIAAACGQLRAEHASENAALVSP